MANLELKDASNEITIIANPDLNTLILRNKKIRGGKDTIWIHADLDNGKSGITLTCSARMCHLHPSLDSQNGLLLE